VYIAIFAVSNLDDPYRTFERGAWCFALQPSLANEPGAIQRWDTRSRRATLDDSDRRCLESQVSLLLPLKKKDWQVETTVHDWDIWIYTLDSPSKLAITSLQ